MADDNDTEKSFSESVVRLKQEVKDGKPIENNDPDWAKTYSVISGESVDSPGQSAKHSLELLAALQPGDAKSDAVWSVFHDDIGKLEQTKDPAKIREAVALLGCAITSENGINGIRDDYGVGTLQNLQNLSDADLAKLNPDARNILTQQLAAVEEGIKNNPSLNNRDDDTVDMGAQYETQIGRLKKAGENKTSQETDAAAASQAWRDHNTSRFFDELDIYAKKNPVGATNLLTDVMTDPSLTDKDTKDRMWSTYSDYIGRLTAGAEDHTEYKDAANKSMQRLYDSLPAEDEVHRNMLINMAANNNYDLKTHKPMVEPPPPQEEKPPAQAPNPDKAALHNPAGSAGAQYAMSDTGGEVTPHLVVPQGDSRAANRQYLS